MLNASAFKSFFLFDESWLKKHWFKAAVALAVVSPLIVSCIYNNSKVLRVSASQLPGHAFMQLGVDEGFISDVDIVPLKDQSEAFRDYLRGELDLIQLRTVEVLDICSRLPEKCPVIVLVLNESVGGDQIMSLKLDSVSDLSGKTVAVDTSIFGSFVIHKGLQKRNLSMDKISLSPMLVTAMPLALSRGEVDAVVLHSPASEKVRDIGGTTIFDSSELPGQILDVLAVDPVVFATRRKDLASIISGWFKTHQFASDHKSYAFSEMGSREGLSAAKFEQSLAGFSFYADEEKQKKMLGIRGAVENNLQYILQSGKEMNLLRVSTPLPKVSNRLIP